MTHDWPAPAKLNLFLYITGRRPDGYHLLQTLFQFIHYGDIITITPTTDGRINLLTSIDGVVDMDNLILRAARLLQRYCWPDAVNNTKLPGANIIINKSIPIGSGLGGGSSNAATVLVALNEQWGCKQSLNTLAKLGLQLGVDIPVFIYGKAAFAEGIGERFVPAYPPEKWYLVTTPPISIITSNIFSDPELKRDSKCRTLTQLLMSPFQNDCESIVRKHFPLIEEHILWLLKYAPARITGTGACVFAEFDTKVSAIQVLSITPAWMNGFIARGVNVSPLHRALVKNID